MKYSALVIERCTVMVSFQLAESQECCGSVIAKFVALVQIHCSVSANTFEPPKSLQEFVFVRVSSNEDMLVQ